jgi:hypothetical protein
MVSRRKPGTLGKKAEGVSDAIMNKLFGLI